jgi:hypothetical protein
MMLNMGLSWGGIYLKAIPLGALKLQLVASTRGHGVKQLVSFTMYMERVQQWVL